MNEKNLVICDKEARYAKGLGDNISERKELTFKVYTCTSAESVHCFLESHKINVLLIDEGFPYEERKGFHAEQVFVLTKENCNIRFSQICLYYFRQNCVRTLIFEYFDLF